MLFINFNSSLKVNTFRLHYKQQPDSNLQKDICLLLYRKPCSKIQGSSLLRQPIGGVSTVPERLT
jgi:hypothetical protein